MPFHAVIQGLLVAQKLVKLKMVVNSDSSQVLYHRIIDCIFCLDSSIFAAGIPDKLELRIIESFLFKLSPCHIAYFSTLFLVETPPPPLLEKLPD